jgi:phosphoribosylamine---glycine ligase
LKRAVRLVRHAGANAEWAMNVLLIGGGGREHALAWALSASPLIGTLHCAPGNPGIAEHATIAALDVTNHDAVAAYCKANGIGFVVVGPEAPLVAGLVDDLAGHGIKAFGPTRFCAQVEGSKGFTKDLCRDFAIPTAAYGRFTDAAAARAYVEKVGAPIVVKADGLAAGKGVVVAMSLKEALAAVDMMFDGGLGEAGSEVVVEGFMVGEEASFFALCDGETALPLATAQDHKRVGDGDVGPNTGGMGAYSPAPVMTPALVERTMAEIIRPTMAAMQAKGHPYKGILYAGLMITAEGPKLIEYNCRFGDPECQVLMMRLKDDLLTLLMGAVDGQLKTMSVRWYDEAALTVVMAANGYPGTPEKGTVIAGLDAAGKVEGVHVFHAGTALKDGQLVANGGRVLNVTAMGNSVGEAQARAYQAVDRITWPGGFCRRDIGWQAVAREKAG